MEFRTSFFSSNGVTGEAGSANGVRWYTVTDTRNGARFETTVSSLALDIARRWATIEADWSYVPQIESPLPAAERQCSGLAGPSGSAANHMSEPVRRMLAAALDNGARRVFRGRLSQGRYPLDMLTAAARRGWLALDDQGGYSPRWGQITERGCAALLREMTKIGA